ncbi:LOW QUALITY PROTEIN: E3 ubiquitin-protein ligase RNF31-like [Boleophthalmus pectinirostris]|uniref:LOW QUALITY PROTEIN: E3 ubiquitin-protein ligase RNF31-like n=1 Tax=Boleophthalmus pectinirostris TaxID=150288 RepID=UPI00242E8351|nr:LOW QUALITY PROTEIN: E3 ubiquitin-protein ligase RNF31-like [Boleophthalmus pectinirostris]
MEETRRRAQSLLSASGQAQDARADVQHLARIPAPLSQKYLHIRAETILRDNTAVKSRHEVLESLVRLSKALGILEKYGCNLTNPTRPKYWRTVKHNNPVFRTTVDAIKGGRSVLFLYGYTNQQIDGLSFPDDVTDPDLEKVVEVTVEVMTLRTEVDLLLKSAHPHPEQFKDIIPFIVQDQDEVNDDVNDVIPIREEPPPEDKPSAVIPPKPAPRIKTLPRQNKAPPVVSDCSLCGIASMFVCPSCNDQSFCDACDDLYHRHPARAAHKREPLHQPTPDPCSICGVSPVHALCSSCHQKLCQNCDRLFHSHPERVGHSRTLLSAAKSHRASLSSWECGHCTTVNEVRAVLCSTCDRPRLSTGPAPNPEPSPTTPQSPNAAWQCKSCTMVNQGSSVLCEVCERPRLATRPPAAPVKAPTSPESLALPVSKWTCQFCTFVNTKPTPICEMCSLSCKDAGGSVSLPAALQTAPAQAPAPAQEGKAPPPIAPKPALGPGTDNQRQKALLQDGLNLINHIREGEKRGVSPEEIYAALKLCGGSNVNPCDWLNSELPHLLDEICAMAASVQLTSAKDHGIPGTAGDGEAAASAVKLSRAEAKHAWLSTGGDTEAAVRQLLQDRQNKMRELRSMGFRDVRKCEEALRLSGGELRGALSLLQRPLLEPYHQRIWTQSEPPIDPKDPDKQRTCRRLLALYDLPSWGRCELVLSLLQEPDVNYNLEDVIQAVKDSPDREFIKRLLQNECGVCYSNFPLSKMRSLTSCQCSLCLECFQKHFTISVTEKHIRDMVCPVCDEPDINDPDQLDNYFSTLDIQLRTCLTTEVYDLFHTKLTEHTLMKDPKFLWCCHCTSGFINDVDQLKVTCPSCHKSFCCKCKKPWEPQHQDVTCEQFQQWKRDNDPEYQKQGLAGYLRDNGITCPNCRFQYALTKGGCIHFTCSQCRYEFCSGCNNPFHKTACRTAVCNLNGLHAHHPRDCLFYLRDWDPPRLQELLKRSNVAFNTEPSAETPAALCGVMEQKDSGQQQDLPCGGETRPGQAGLCEKHYREYLVSLINVHSLDPAVLYQPQELVLACQRYQVPTQKMDNENENNYNARLLKKLMEVPLGDKVPRNQ